MKPFDFNVHLKPPHLSLAEEMTQNPMAFIGSFAADGLKLKSHLSAANFMIFNPRLNANELNTVTRHLKSSLPGSLVTLLCDFRQPNDFAALKSAGIDGIKFHAYAQRIEKTEIPAAVTAAKQAAKAGLFVCIDTSYGTAGLYRYDNMALAASIAEAVTMVPVILIHAGATRVLDALLIADACPNVWLESSFALRWLEGSSVERDFAFAFKKLNYERILYGSDHPYADAEESTQHIRRFFKRFDLDETGLKKLLFENSGKLKGELA